MNLYEASIRGARPLAPEDSITLGQGRRGRVFIPIAPGEGDYFRVRVTSGGVMLRPRRVMLRRCSDHPGYILVVADAGECLFNRACVFEDYPIPEIISEGRGVHRYGRIRDFYQVALLRMRPGEAFQLHVSFTHKQIFVADADGLRSYTEAEWDAASGPQSIEEGDFRWQ